jgi:hypothetical protein
MNNINIQDLAGKRNKFYVSTVKSAETNFENKYITEANIKLTVKPG